MPGSMFSGQFGGFGGGFIGGPSNGQTQAPGAQFGGGFMMNPMAQAGQPQAVAVAPGTVTYAASPNQFRPKDRSGRKDWGGTWGDGNHHGRGRY